MKHHILYICHILLIYNIVISIFNYNVVESTPTWNLVDVGDSNSLIKDLNEFASVGVSHDWFFFGGIANSKYSNSLIKYDSNSSVWTNVICQGELPCPRSGSSLTLLNNSLILFGGQNYDGSFSDIFSLDLSTFRWEKLRVTYTIEGRSGHATTTDGHSIYIFGGYNENGTYLNDLWQLTIEDNVVVFKLIGDGTVPESENATITYLLGDIYLIGGYKNNTKKVWKFTDKWNPIIPPIQINLPYNHTCIRVGHSILLLGGVYNNYSMTSYNDQIWIFSTITNSWTILPIYNDSKYPISATVLYDSIYILSNDGKIYILNDLPLCGFGSELCSGKGTCNGKICNCMDGHYSYDCGESVISDLNINESISNIGGNSNITSYLIHFMITCCIIAGLYYGTREKKRRGDENMTPLF